jgi:murein DD-endopeptidase / murein LD-carboxypeptidase
MKTAFFVLFLLSSVCGFSQQQQDSLKGASENQAVKTDSVLGIPHKVYAYFIQKGLTIDSLSNPALYIAVYPWMDFPYRYGGKGQRGIDCSGFTKRMFLDVFGHILRGGGSRDIYAGDVIPIPRDSLREGDLVFFKIRKGVISHVGIYLSNNKFVHATTQAGVIVSDLDEAYYRKYYYASGRVVVPEKTQLPR